MSFGLALMENILPGFSDFRNRGIASEIIKQQQAGQLTPEEAVMSYAEKTGDMGLARGVYQNKIKSEALSQLPAALGMIGGGANVPKLQPQQISAKLPVMQEEPQSAVSALNALAQSGLITPAQALTNVASRRGSVGSIERIANRLLQDAANRGQPIDFRTALQLAQGGARQGISVDPQGNIVPATGYTKTISDIEKAKKAGQIIGTGAGEAQEALTSQLSKLPELNKKMSELKKLSEKATYTWLGQGRDIATKQLGLGTTEGAKARAEYISKVSNQILPLLRDTFGAQFTEREGQTLRDTLGNPNYTPEEKQVVLESFISQKEADIRSLRRRTDVVETTASRIDGKKEPSGIQINETIEKATKPTTIRFEDIPE